MNTSLANEIKRTLHYFWFFKHALTIEELRFYLGCTVHPEELRIKLDELIRKEEVYSDTVWFALEKSHLDKKSKYLDLNKHRLRQGRLIGALIYCFPFVRGVYLSGSLSKQGIQSKEDDIDFFILTASNRVWTAKLYLIIFKKIFLLNSEKYFCINFLMDQQRLELLKRNKYTATELVSLIPIKDCGGLEDLWAANPWTKSYFPNASLKAYPTNKRMKNRFYERLSNFLFGNRLEEWARQKFTVHMQEHTDHEEGYYEAEPHTSAYFPQSIELRLLSHLENFRDE
jgi:hypothetical protein